MSYKKIPGSYTFDGNAKVPINCVWLDTLYWRFQWNFDEAKICDCIGSARLKISQLDSMFFLQVHKASDTSFTVQLHRIIKDDMPDDGFILHFMLSVVGLESKPIDEYLTSSDDFFSIRCDFNPKNMKGDYWWTIKCYCEMCEITNLENEASKEQNKLIEDVKKCKENMEYKLSSMACLLRRPELQNVFSGRQSYEFAETEVEIIDRTIDFADEILLFLSSQLAGVPNEPNTWLLCEILGYIYKRDSVPIEEREIIVLYYMAYRYGLRYLQSLCREVISRNLRDINSIVNVFVACDVLFEDSPLVDLLVEEFYRRRGEILSSTTWQTLRCIRLPIAGSIIDTVLRKVQEEETSSDYQTEEIIDMDEMIEILNRLLV